MSVCPIEALGLRGRGGRLNARNQCTQSLCTAPQAERVTKMLAIAQQSATDAKERCSTLEAELRRMQSRRDALVDENTALSHKVRSLALPWCG